MIKCMKRGRGRLHCVVCLLEACQRFLCNVIERIHLVVAVCLACALEILHGRINETSSFCYERLLPTCEIVMLTLTTYLRLVWNVQISLYVSTSAPGISVSHCTAGPVDSKSALVPLECFGVSTMRRKHLCYSSQHFKAKARVTSGGANVIGKRLHKTGVSSFVKHTFASALNALCSETATYRPDKPHRVVPFRTWAQVLAHLEEKLQMSMPASTFQQLRKWPSCHDIRRLRTTEHSKCDTCTRLTAAIERCPGAIERARLQQELREHLRLCAAQRTTFYEHNTKAM